MARHGTTGLFASALLTALAMCGGDAQRPIDPPHASAQVPEAEPEQVSFDPSVAAAPPAVMAALSANRVAPLIETERDAYAQGLLLWVSAERGERANESLAQLASMDHPLAAWAGLRLAERLEESDVARALELATPLAELEWTGQTRARRIQARALLASGEVDDAMSRLRALVEETPDRIGGASAAMPLADHLASLEDDASRLEALALYRRVATRAPKAAVGEEARTKAAEVLATLPEEVREAHADVPMADRLAEAHALYGAMHHRDAAAAYASLLDAMDDDDPRHCEASLERGKALLRARNREEGAPFMHEVAERCDGDVRAWARYKAGRAFGQLGQKARALAEYAALFDEAPTHRLADDALYWTARLQDDDDEAFTSALTRLVDELPGGDMAGDAFFELAMHAREKAELETALSWLERSVAAGAGEEAEDLRGRAAYWRARVLGELERDSADAYEQIARAWPLSYYGQQAVARLREQDAARAQSIEADMRDDGDVLTFPWRHELDDARFKTALSLLQVGATSDARAELDAIGLTGAGADPDAVWLSAALFEAAGALPECTRLVRRRLESFRGALPTGGARPLWRLAYPKAFAPLIETAAGEVDVPPALVRAIAREESSFDPSAVSWAHAYGLTQVILPTARRFGRELDTRITPRTLRQPEVNLAVGSRYLAYLRDRFSANPALVPAAYNAGHGALSRWIRQRGDLDMDEFVEAIPYEETRRYTRRVIQSHGIYSWLDEGRLPELPRNVR